MFLLPDRRRIRWQAQARRRRHDPVDRAMALATVAVVEHSLRFGAVAGARKSTSTVILGGSVEPQINQS
jgi:hypothetical protein